MITLTFSPATIPPMSGSTSDSYTSLSDACTSKIRENVCFSPSDLPEGTSSIALPAMKMEPLSSFWLSADPTTRAHERTGTPPGAAMASAPNARANTTRLLAEPAKRNCRLTQVFLIHSTLELGIHYRLAAQQPR